MSAAVLRLISIAFNDRSELKVNNIFDGTSKAAFVSEWVRMCVLNVFPMVSLRSGPNVKCSRML